MSDSQSFNAENSPLHQQKVYFWLTVTPVVLKSGVNRFVGTMDINGTNCRVQGKKKENN